MITSVHKNMKRVLLSDAGVRNYYLDGDDSLLLAGTTYFEEQTAAAGTAGLQLVGNFPNAVVGQYVVNDTKNFFAQILATDGTNVTLHYALQTAEKKWGQATATTTNKLISSAATFTATVEVGMIAALRDLSDYAVILAVDSDTELSLSKDIFPSGTDYTIMAGFEVGDSVKVGTAILDGTQGQVKTEIPKFYYGFKYEGGLKWATSPFPVKGFEVHPAFMVNGVEKEYIYVGSFEGAINKRTQGTNDLTSYNLGTTKLNSLPGLHQVTNGQRSEFRTVCGNRGAGFQQEDWHIRWAIQLLFLTEYETLDSQKALGAGFTDWNSTTWINGYNGTIASGQYYAVSQTGFSLRNGNNSANVNGGDGFVGSYNSYRGIENFWGNIWKFMDGVNYNDGRVYLANDPANYADDIATTPYVDTTFNQPVTSGYISKVHPSKNGFIVKESAGGSTTYIPDYYWYNPGWRVARSGAHAATGVLAGFAALATNNPSANRYTYIGSRACFR